MACLKCGKKTKDEQVFCAHCLEVMENYPVKRDVHIQLPNRPDAAAQKKHSRKRRNLTADEQVAQLRWKLRQQSAIMAVLIFALLFTAATLLYTALSQDEPDVGKNYTYEEILE